MTITIPDAMSLSFIGRLTDSVHLDACSLANIVLNILSMSLIQGMLSASDTLSPQAFALGNLREVGLLSMRSFVACIILVIPVNLVALPFMRAMLLFIKEDPGVTSKALYWYHYYLCVLPLDLLFYIIWKFLSAQSILKPLVIVGLFTNLFVLPQCLGFFITEMGYIGSVISKIIFQVTQISLLMLYLTVYHRQNETWPGLKCFREAITWPKMKVFMSLGFGGVLAATDWWFWEIINALAGSLGVIPFSIHTVPTQVMNIAYMVPLGIGLALNVRLAHALATDVERAKKLLLACYLLSFFVVLVMSFLLYYYRWWLFRSFSRDSLVIEGCDRIWVSVIIFFINLSIYGVNAGALITLGKQWVLGLFTFICLWLVALPMIYCYAIRRRGGIEMLWKKMYPPYVVLNTLLCIVVFLSDWNVVGSTMRNRAVTVIACREYGSLRINKS